MYIEFARPWALALIPFCIAFIWCVGRVYLNKSYRGGLNSNVAGANGRAAPGSAAGGKPPRGVKAGIKRLFATATRKRTFKEITYTAARYALVLVTILALAGPSITAPSRNNATWLLVDGSDSVRANASQITAAVRSGLAHAPADLQTGVIAFGSNALVESPLSLTHSYAGILNSIERTGSSLSSALTLAEALLPSDAAGRIAVVSDGFTDDATYQAQQLAARGIAIDVYEAPHIAAPDAQVSSLALPAQLYQGQSFSVDVGIHSNMDTSGTLVLYANRQPVMTRDITLRPGENSFTFKQLAQSSGVVTYEAQLIADGDQASENNKSAAYVNVQGAANVLIVEGQTGAARELAKLLAASGILAEVISTDRLPETAERFQSYESIVLANVGADQMSAAAFSALENAVRYMGRGLCVLGGDNSFALGGYRGADIERLLPVTIDVKSTLDMPSLALVLVIDKSGSMTEGQFGTTRLELAKEAAIRATEVLLDSDSIGVIAFDDAAKWVVELQAASDKAAIEASIGTIRPGGGTAFYSALSEAYRALSESDAAQKHVIFLTDGQPGDNGYQTIVGQMPQQDITFTTVSVGSGADSRLLAQLAALGNGRHYATGEFDDIPKIFTKETYLAAGRFVQDRAFTPIITEKSSLTNYGALPSLYGYLATTAKPNASVALVSDRDEPILAHWKYGAGEVLCWTSDITGGWTEAFLNWGSASEFFAGMVAATFGERASAGALETSNVDGNINVTFTSNEAPASAAVRTELALVSPSGAESTLPMIASAPGVYTATISQAEHGAYALNVTQYQGDALLSSQSGGALMAYSAEYDMRAYSADSNLAALAALTNGAVITDPAQLFAGTHESVERRIDLLPVLLAIIYALILLDIALRKLPWERWVVKLRHSHARLHGNAPGNAPVKPPVTAESVRPEPAVHPRDSAEEAHEEPATKTTADQLLEAKRNKRLF